MENNISSKTIVDEFIERDDDDPVSLWYKYDMGNEKQYSMCIKHIQKLVRGSMSYDQWQKRSKWGVQKCPICEIEKDYVKMESHHYPATLYDVVDNYLQYLIDTDELKNKTDFDVCQEIMDQHFLRKVDYIVLCEYCHKKYHDDIPEILDVIDEKYKEQKKERESYFK